MGLNSLLKKLYLEKQKFVTSETLRKYCEDFGISYDGTVKNLLYRKHLIRIFKGIFYVKSLDEIKIGKTDYSTDEIVAKGLQLKKVKNWYFGLNTALKMNNITHEEFNVEYVITDSVFRKNPMDIAGRKYKFYRIKSALLEFGIRNENLIRFSDSEKTILDMIYLRRYNGIPNKRIILDLSDYVDTISKKKILGYVKHYPKTVRKTLDELL